MANKNLLRRRGELRSESSSESEAEAPPSLPEASPNNVGVLISNPAWLRYKRRIDVYEEKVDESSD